MSWFGTWFGGYPDAPTPEPEPGPTPLPAAISASSPAYNDFVGIALDRLCEQFRLTGAGEESTPVVEAPEPEPDPGDLEPVTDASSGIVIPRTADQWENLASLAGTATPTWDITFGCDDATSDDAAYTLSELASGATFGSSVAGWSKLGIHLPSGDRLSVAPSSGLPNLSTGSMTALVIAKVNSTDASYRRLVDIGNGTCWLGLNGSTQHVVNCNAGLASVVASVLGSVRPFVLTLNRGTTTCYGLTDAAAVHPAFGADDLNKGLTIGGNDQVDMTVLSVYVSFTPYSEAMMKSLLTACGWSMPP